MPGAGTSTVSRIVATTLGLEHVDGGTVFRSMAAERALDVNAFSLIAEGDAAIDIELDERLADRARQGDVVLESRLAGWIAVNEDQPATKVWIDAQPDERARRVAARERISVDAALEADEERERSERLRYRTYYGIDLDDLSIYDLVIDSTATPAAEIAKSIVTSLSR